jgi:hypothetical protein
LPTFLDEVFGSFYATAPTAKHEYSFGQFFWIPAYYPHQRLEIWRPDQVNQQLGTASDFNIRSGLGDAFRRQIPYAFPALKTDEEFIVIKGKHRPVILLQPPDPALQAIKTGGYSGKIVRHLCPVALIFSVADDVGNSKFSPEFLERVRRLEYPQFLFLPKGGPLMVDSLVRLDEIQSVTESQLNPTGFGLAKEVHDIFRSQVSFFLSGLSGKEFTDWASELRK